MIVRWLGAFRKGTSPLQESLQWEIKNSKKSSTGEFAAEILKKGISQVNHSNIGLLVSNKAIVKRFNGDCWSEKAENGKLVKTRNPKEAKSSHLECWINPVYKGIVIKNYSNIKATSRRVCYNVAKNNNLPVFSLSNNGKLEEVFL